jgi:hypothetical protein
MQRGLSQMKTFTHIRAFEATSVLVIALTVLWFAGLIAFAAAHHARLL